MKINKKKGFTLVELLAVIVILAIILVIAVPKVMSVIEDSKKATLEATAKMIAGSAEKAKVQNTILGKTEEITCDSVAKLNDIDYASCEVEFVDNTAKVTIKGSGKFDGLWVCAGDKTTATATSEECGSSNTLVAHIQSLFNNETTRQSNGLVKDTSVDENIRYAGSNDVVKNYVEFGNTNELWRIIGIFKVQTPNGPEELVKIVREDSVGNIVWDISDIIINDGYGINQWGESGDYLGADLMQLLNESYLSKQDVEDACFDWVTEETGTCSFSSTGMSTSYENMIETVVWNTGAINPEDTTIVDFENSNLDIAKLYDAERGTVGKTCSATDSEGNANSYCNDTVTRTSTWTGQVALPYPTDWGYAGSETGCNTNMWTGLNVEAFTTSCKNNNWMHYGTSSENMEEFTWFLSTIAHPDVAYRVFFVDGGGMANNFYADHPFRVRPTLYLKADSILYGGDGTRLKPYSLVEKDDYTVTTDETCFAFDSENGLITGYDIDCGTNVVIPSKINNVDVIGIGTDAFNTCGAEVSKLVSNNKYEISNLEGNKEDISLTPIYEACYGIGITSVVLPNTVETIGDSAFVDNLISRVNIPSSVTSIGATAFYENPLTNVYLGNQNATIGNSAFGCRDDIETHNLPSSYSGCK